MSKKWWASKTVWTNVLATIFGTLQATGVVTAPIPVEDQIGILGVVNLVLRLVTKGSVTLS